MADEIFVPLLLDLCLNLFAIWITLFVTILPLIAPAIHALLFGKPAVLI